MDAAAAPSSTGLLMAVVGTDHAAQDAKLAFGPAEIKRHLTPESGGKLHFAIDGDSAHWLIPYWEVADEAFTCYPILGDVAVPAAERVGAGDLALASRGATATADSEFVRDPSPASNVIDGIVATEESFANRWHSSLDTPHPHWIQVKLAKPERIGRIVIRFADPGGYPTSFQGVATVDGAERVLFDQKANTDTRKFEARFAPIVTQTFRLVIRQSANPVYPNAAQISEIEIYPPAAKQ